MDIIKKVWKTLCIITILLSIVSIIKIEKTRPKIATIKTNYLQRIAIPKKEIEKPIGKIIIPKININKPLYKIGSKKNNIEENITIIKKMSNPDIIIIAAHSGTGEKAFFKNLNQLKVNDIIIIIWNNNELTYTVDKVWKEEKMGYIRLPNSIQNNLILTTCDPTEENMQLIIGCTKKESK